MGKRNFWTFGGVFGFNKHICILQLIDAEYIDVGCFSLFLLSSLCREAPDSIAFVRFCILGTSSIGHFEELLINIWLRYSTVANML